MLEKVRSRWPDILLSCDANAAYTMDDVEHLKKFDRFNLLMFEQPLWNDDIYYHARLQKQLKTSICLDESIRNARDAEAAIELGACRIINIKVGRVGRLHRSPQDSRRLPEQQYSRVVRRHAGIRHRAHSEYCSVVSVEFQPAGRCVGFKTLLERRHYRTGGGSESARNDPSRDRAATGVRKDLIEKITDRKETFEERNQRHVSGADLGTAVFCSQLTTAACCFFLSTIPHPGQSSSPRDTGWKSLKVSSRFDVQALEQQNFSGELQTHVSEVPIHRVPLRLARP